MGLPKEGPARNLNKSFFLNTFRVGGAVLGQALIQQGFFEQPLKLTDAGMYHNHLEPRVPFAISSAPPH